MKTTFQGIDADEFLTTTLLAKLRQLTTDTQPAWGILTPQHMIEHVAETMAASNTRNPVPLKMPAEMLEKSRKYGLDPRAFHQNLKHPISHGELQPLRTKNLDSALDALSVELKAFFHHFEQNPNDTQIHPSFGPLNFEEWKYVHVKHFMHHLVQFGLATYAEKA